MTQNYEKLRQAVEAVREDVDKAVKGNKAATSRVLSGSWCSSRASNCVGSGYPARTTRAIPATPVGSALEW